MKCFSCSLGFLIRSRIHLVQMVQQIFFIFIIIAVVYSMLLFTSYLIFQFFISFYKIINNLGEMIYDSLCSVNKNN